MSTAFNPADRLKEVLEEARQYAEGHGTAVGALFRIAQGVENPRAAALATLRQLGGHELAALAEGDGCEVCGGPSAGRTLDDVELCDEHAPKGGG